VRVILERTSKEALVIMQLLDHQPAQERRCRLIEALWPSNGA